jgi:hypothetical protein
MTCSSARYIVIAGFVGVAASALAGSDAIGVLAALAAVLVVALAERVVPRRRPTSCAVAPPEGSNPR